jgi:hypothetical protein
VSLINDALRKARQAASDHDARRATSTRSLRPAYPRRGRGHPLALLLGAVAVVAGLAGAAGAWWLLERPREPVEAQVAESQPPAIDAPPVAPEVVESELSEPPAAPPPVSTEIATPTPRPTVDRPAATAPEAEITPTVRDEPGPSPDAPTAAADGGERVFVLEAELDGRTLSLGFIVAGGDRPFAEINGREVSIGFEIEGFVVEAIEPDRVVLRDTDGPLVLRVP